MKYLPLCRVGLLFHWYGWRGRTFNRNAWGIERGGHQWPTVYLGPLKVYTGPA